MGFSRGCGVREPGGIYFEAAKCTPAGRQQGLCRSVWSFLFDPPLPLGDVEIPDRGVLIMERPDGSGVHDVWDRVGESGYPNVADMVEEIKYFGLSRRASKSLDFSLLSTESIIFLIHPRAILLNHDDLYDYLISEVEETPHHAHEFKCPCGRVAHQHLPRVGSTDDPIGYQRQMCAGLWWECVTKAEPVYDLAAPRRSCTRQSGSLTYAARHLPHGFKPQYAPGIFARFPIGNLAVINDPEGGQDKAALRRLEGVRLPVLRLDE